MGSVDPVHRLRDLCARLRRLPDIPWLEVELGDEPVLFVRVRGRSIRGTLPGVMVRRRRRVFIGEDPNLADIAVDDGEVLCPNV